MYIWGGGGGKGCSRERKGGGWMGVVIGTYGERRVNSRDDVCSADLKGSKPFGRISDLWRFLLFLLREQPFAGLVGETPMQSGHVQEAACGG